MIQESGLPAPLFAPLKQELSRWEAAGRRATFWFRDDDAVTMTPEFARLLDFQQAYSLPIAIAVIPQQADDQLPPIIQERPELSVLQHGWSHTNYAAEGEWHSEFPAGRPAEKVKGNLNSGKMFLEKLFGHQFIFGFVPPWNHFASEYLPLLKSYQFISGRDYTVARDWRMVPSIPADVDVLRWGPAPHFRGTERLISEICKQLAARRKENRKDPVGILLHHLNMDHASWEFMNSLAGVLQGHAAVNLLNIRTADFWEMSAQNIPMRAPAPLAVRACDYVMRAAGDFNAWVQGLLADITLPKPAYAFASVILLGMLTGHILGSTASYAQDGLTVSHEIQMDADDTP